VGEVGDSPASALTPSRRSDMMRALAWREALPTSALRTGGTRQYGGYPVLPIRINIWFVIIVVFIVLVLLGVVGITLR